jgi:hypothetical protein
MLKHKGISRIKWPLRKQKFSGCNGSLNRIIASRRACLLSVLKIVQGARCPAQQGLLLLLLLLLLLYTMRSFGVQRYLYTFWEPVRYVSSVIYLTTLFIHFYSQLFIMGRDMCHICSRKTNVLCLLWRAGCALFIRLEIMRFLCFVDRASRNRCVIKPTWCIICLQFIESLHFYMFRACY